MLRRPSPALALVLLALALAPAGCGGGGSSPGPDPGPGGDCVAGTGPEVLVAGSIRYERLVLSSGGLGPDTEIRPARFVDVEVRLEGGGTCQGRTRTDATGAFLLAVRPPGGSRLEVWAWSRTVDDPLRAVTVHDALPPAADVHGTTDAFRATSAAFAAGSTAPVDLLIPYPLHPSSRPAIGFAVFDVLVGLADAVRAATGSAPPRCHAYTRLGNAGSIGTTWYDDDANAIAILGGAAGNLDGSDTDYFDDPVIAHEYAHFLEFHLSHSLTRGGPHSGEALEPNFAWSEGQATGFGTLLRNDPAYVDSVTTGGGTFFDASAEDWPQVVRGIGSEESVLEIVWDLADGADGVPDADADPVAVPLASLFAAVASFDPAEDAPYVGLFLDRLVAAGAVAAGSIAELLGRPEDQKIGYPLAGADEWPIPLAAPGSVNGVVDSTTGNPCRGLDASRWYRFDLAAPRRLAFDLLVQSLPGGGDDVNLYLLDLAGKVIASSTNGGSASEHLAARTLSAGSWLVRVEANCSGAGHRAGFSLTVSEEAP